MLNRALLCSLVLALSTLGCQPSHQENKEAALKRWNHARSQLTVDMARQQYENGNINKAIKTVKHALETDPQSAPASLLLAQIYLEKNQLGRAREYFDKSLSLDPANAQAYYGLGIIHEKWNELEQAFASYQAAWDQQPDHIPYLLAMAETRVAQGRLADALQILTEQAGHRNRNASVCLAAGNILTTLERHDQALRMFQRAHSANPEDLAIKESLAFALYRAGDTEKALLAFKELLDVTTAQSSDDVWAYHLALGDCHLRLAHYHDAQRCFEVVRDHDINNPAVWTRLAQTAIGRQDYSQARYYAQKALSLQNDQSEALMVLGYAALKERQYQQAQEFLNQVTKLDSRNGLAYCLLGQTLQAAGDPSQAKACYARALEINPQDTLARHLIRTVDQTQLGATAVMQNF